MSWSQRGKACEALLKTVSLSPNGWSYGATKRGRPVLLPVKFVIYPFLWCLGPETEVLTSLSVSLLTHRGQFFFFVALSLHCFDSLECFMFLESVWCVSEFKMYNWGLKLMLFYWKLFLNCVNNCIWHLKWRSLFKTCSVKQVEQVKVKVEIEDFFFKCPVDF